MNVELERKAIERIRAFAPYNGEPYYLAYSGGKDSDTILILAELAGVKYEARHNLTTVDAPETVQYVKLKPNVVIEYPHTSMWEVIPEKLMPPTRVVRYCCEIFKEGGGSGRLRLTGVRWAESLARAKNNGAVSIRGKPKTTQKLADELGADYAVNEKGGIVLNLDNAKSRQMVENCYRTRTVLVNPIIEWTDDEVWSFLHHYGCKSNPLYEVKEKDGKYYPCGRKRIGCIGCPMQNGKGMKKDFAQYPKYRDAYLRAFKKMIDERQKRGLKNNYLWNTARDVMIWWVGDDPAQSRLFEPEYLKGAPEI